MIDRMTVLVHDIPRDAKVIEIGPSYSPMLSKRDGWKVTVVDHETREGLIAKYGAIASIDTSRIEEVDFVWSGGSLLDLVGVEHRSGYDAFVASHVIEHTTDVVRFLQSAEALVKIRGTIRLAVPDKRKCFDLFRPLSTTADALVAYIERRERHNAKTHFENAIYMVNRSGVSGWSIEDRSDAVLAHRIEDAPHLMALADHEDYIDAHSWTFTPASFELMVLELTALGLLKLKVDRTQEAQSIEFFAWLTPSVEQLDSDSVHRDRLALLQRIVVEQAEASRQVTGSPLASRSASNVSGP